MTSAILVNINGKRANKVANQPAEPGLVGLLVGSHSIGVSFDNFEFEELQP